MQHYCVNDRFRRGKIVNKKVRGRKREPGRIVGGRGREEMRSGDERELLNACFVYL